MYVVGLEHDARESHQGTSAHTDTSDMADVVADTLHERRTGAHRYHYHPVDVGLVAGAQSVGDKLVGLGCGQTIDGRVDVSCAYACNHDLFHVAQTDFVVIEILAEGAVERSHRVGGLDALGRYHLAFVVNSHYLGGAYAHIYTYYNSHCQGCDYYGAKVAKKAGL